MRKHTTINYFTLLSRVVFNGELITCSAGVAVSVPSSFSVAQSQSLLSNLNS
jgi:hypothetical protein